MRVLIRTLIPLAIAVSYAQAQSPLNVYGSIDGGLRYATNADIAGRGLISTTSGSYNANRLGFRAVESFSGGFSGYVQLETGFNVKSGELDNNNGVIFNRMAALGVEGPPGAITVGHLYTIAFKTELFLDPFNHHYTGIIPLAAGAGTSLPQAAIAAGLGASSSSGARFDDDVQYAGKLGDFTAKAEYSTSRYSGRKIARAFGLTYEGQTLFAATALTRREAANGSKNNSYVLGGGFKLNDVTAKFGLSAERQDSLHAQFFRARTSWAGLNWTTLQSFEFTAGEYRTRYDGAGTTGFRTLQIVGLAWPLSDRTRVYGEFERNKFKGSLIPNYGQSRQMGASIGISHMF